MNPIFNVNLENGFRSNALPSCQNISEYWKIENVSQKQLKMKRNVIEKSIEFEIHPLKFVFENNTGAVYGKQIHFRSFGDHCKHGLIEVIGPRSCIKCPRHGRSNQLRMNLKICHFDLLPITERFVIGTGYTVKNTIEWLIFFIIAIRTLFLEKLSRLLLIFGNNNANTRPTVILNEYFHFDLKWLADKQRPWVTPSGFDICRHVR